MHTNIKSSSLAFVLIVASGISSAKNYQGVIVWNPSSGTSNQMENSDDATSKEY